ncbi:MAG: DUF4054 domain-containing protein [Chroococcidiopsis sp.]
MQNLLTFRELFPEFSDRSDPIINHYLLLADSLAPCYCPCLKDSIVLYYAAHFLSLLSCEGAIVKDLTSYDERISYAIKAVEAGSLATTSYGSILQTLLSKCEQEGAIASLSNRRLMLQQNWEEDCSCEC